MDETPQSACNADDERADSKRAELGVHGPYANHGRRHIHVAYGHPFTADRAAHQIFGQQGNHHQNTQAQKVLAHRAFNRYAQYLKLRHRNRARRRVVGQPLDPQKHPVTEKLCGQCGNRQVQALDAQAGQAKENTKHHGANPTQDQRRYQWHVGNTHKKVVSAVCAHGHECAGAQRYLPTVTDQNIHAKSCQRNDQKRNQDGPEQIVAGQHRHSHKRKQ